MHLQRLLPILAVLGFLDLGLAKCACKGSGQAVKVDSGCHSKCAQHFSDTLGANYCAQGCNKWEVNHNCAPHSKRTANSVEHDDVAELAYDLIGRDALEELASPEEDAEVDSDPMDETDEPDEPDDLSSCLSSCRSAARMAGHCRPTTINLVGTAFYHACVGACRRIYSHGG